jgi:hypothetical protein
MFDRVIGMVLASIAVWSVVAACGQLIEISRVFGG